MEHANADRMLSEAELETVNGGHAISASLDRFVASNAGSDDDMSNALAAVVESLRRQPKRRG